MISPDELVSVHEKMLTKIRDDQPDGYGMVLLLFPLEEDGMAVGQIIPEESREVLPQILDSLLENLVGGEELPEGEVY